MMKSQENDIRDMVQQMRFQFSDLREKYLYELDDIEREFSNEVKLNFSCFLLIFFFFFILAKFHVGIPQKRIRSIIFKPS